MVESKSDNWQECPQFYNRILHSSEIRVSADQPDFESVARDRMENLIGWSKGPKKSGYISDHFWVGEMTYFLSPLMCQRLLGLLVLWEGLLNLSFMIIWEWQRDVTIIPPIAQINIRQIFFSWIGEMDGAMKDLHWRSYIRKQ